MCSIASQKWCSIAFKEVEKQTKKGADKDKEAKRQRKKKHKKDISWKRPAPVVTQAQAPSTKRCTRRNTKVLGWSKRINAEDPLGQ